VAMAKNSFRHGWRYPYESGGFAEGSEDSFYDFYNRHGKKAGIYIGKGEFLSTNGTTWSYAYGENVEEVAKSEKEVENKKIIGMLAPIGFIAVIVGGAILISILTGNFN